MSIEHCHDCGLDIDTDYDVGHDADCLMKNKQEVHLEILGILQDCDGFVVGYDLSSLIEQLKELLEQHKTHILNEVIEEIEKGITVDREFVGTIDQVLPYKQAQEDIITHLKNK